jgi:hypothetical protein
MRYRSLNAVSLLVIVLCFSAIRIIPALRYTMREASGLGPPERFDFLAEAERRGDDANAWLAAMAPMPPQEITPEDLERAYRRASELAPVSAVPHFLYAEETIYGPGDGVPLNRDEINAETKPRSEANAVRERPLTPDERQLLTKAREALQRAGGLEPANAAVDYLLAYLAFAEHEDEEAVRRLRAAVSKRGWSLHQRDVAIASLHVRDHPSLTGVSRSGFSLLLLSRTIAGMAVLAEQRGDHSHAIFLRQADIHLAQLMLREGYDIIEGLMGVIAWRVGTELDLTDAETKAAEAKGEAAAVSRKQADLESARYQACKRAAREKMAQYFRQHGRADLAEDVVSFSDAADGFLRNYQDHRRAGLGMSALWRAIPVFALASVETLPVLAGLLVLALLLVVARRAIHPIKYPRRAWVFVGVAFLALIPVEGYLREHSRQLFAVVALPALLAAMLVITAIHRLTHREERPAGFIGHYLGTAIAVLLPLAALLCLITLGLDTVAALKLGKLANNALVYQGEMAYYHLRVPR